MPIITLAAVSALAATPAPPSPVVIQSGWQLQDVAKATQAAAEISTAKYKPAVGIRPQFPAPCLLRLSTIASIPNRCMARTTAPKSFLTAWRVPHGGTGQQISSPTLL